MAATAMVAIDATGAGATLTDGGSMDRRRDDAVREDPMGHQDHSDHRRKVNGDRHRRAKVDDLSARHRVRAGRRRTIGRAMSSRFSTSANHSAG
jgi:hypothetical protein